MALSPAATDVLRRVRELLPTLRTASEETASLLQEGNTARGMLGLTELVTGLQGLQKALEFLCSACSPSLSRFEGSRARLEAVYPAMLTAIENEDPVAISDVLTYELVPALEAFENSLRSDIQ